MYVLTLTANFQGISICIDIMVKILKKYNTVILFATIKQQLKILHQNLFRLERAA